MKIFPHHSLSSSIYWFADSSISPHHPSLSLFYISILQKQEEKMTEANQHNLSISKKNKKLILAIFASFLLVATIIAIVTGVNPQKKSTQNDAAHAKLRKSTFPTNAFLLQVNRSIDAAQSNMVALSRQKATNTK